MLKNKEQHFSSVLYLYWRYIDVKYIYINKLSLIKIALMYLNRFSIISLMFILMIAISCKREKSQLSTKETVKVKDSFSNKKMYPLINGCETAEKPTCFENNISDLILTQIKEENLFFENDTLQVGVQVSEDGIVTIQKNETKNPLLEETSSRALNSLPRIEPAYSQFTNKYVNMSLSWFIIIKNNEIVNRFE